MILIPALWTPFQGNRLERVDMPLRVESRDQQIPILVLPDADGRHAFLDEIGLLRAGLLGVYKLGEGPF